MQNKYPLPGRIKIALGMLAAGVLLTLLAPKIPLGSSSAAPLIPNSRQGDVVHCKSGAVSPCSVDVTDLNPTEVKRNESP